eukprot:gene7338-5172_t
MRYLFPKRKMEAELQLSPARYLLTKLSSAIRKRKKEKETDKVRKREQGINIDYDLVDLLVYLYLPFAIRHACREQALVDGRERKRRVSHLAAAVQM